MKIDFTTKINIYVKIIRSSHNQFFKPNANKLQALTNLMLNISPCIIDTTNLYLSIWRKSGRIVKSLPDKEDCAHLTFSARINQIIAAHASGQARAIIAKIEKAKKTPENKRNKSQWAILKKTEFSLTDMKVNLPLDCRVAWIEEGSNSFDYMIVFRFPVKDIGCKKFYLPMKKSKHMRNLEARGFKLKPSAIRLNADCSITLAYEKEVTLKTGHACASIDLGRNKAIARSDGETFEPLDALLTKIDRKKTGSKSHTRAKTELKQVVNRAAKCALDYENLAVIHMENLKDMKRGKKWGNKNHHWPVGLLQERISSWADEHGVRVIRVNPAYTSQTCSVCGHRDKKNRVGEKFLCLGCGHEADADINAALNIGQRGTYMSLYLKQQNPLDGVADLGEPVLSG